MIGVFGINLLLILNGGIINYIIYYFSFWELGSKLLLRSCLF